MCMSKILMFLGAVLALFGFIAYLVGDTADSGILMLQGGLSVGVGIGLMISAFYVESRSVKLGC